MNRLEKHMVALKAKNEKALILFLTAGDPDLDTTLDIMGALSHNGVDCIELGVPFSDPIADGPIIQKSTSRALVNKVNVDHIFNTVRRFRQNYNTPVVLMGYYNPIIRYGLNTFAESFKNSGGDGLIIADLPYEEGEEFERICSQNDICLIYLLAPEIGSDRTKKILSASKGFVYCVSHYGTTGISEAPTRDVDEVIQSLKSMTDLPVAIGFGISSLEKAKSASKIADGIIIGSWLIRELEKAHDKAKAAGEFTKAVKSAILF
jgi:tryptophan synthase alpha chain